MDNVLYFLSVAGIVVTVVWAIKNANVPRLGRTVWLLAMKDRDMQSTPAPKKRSRRLFRR